MRGNVSTRCMRRPAARSSAYSMRMNPAHIPAKHIPVSLDEPRQCGACTACCHVLEIDDPQLKKAAGTLCSHCSGGCSIYAQRPKVCRDWLCMWREFPSLLDESWRPDRCGVLMRMAEVDTSGVEAPYFEV